MSDILSDSDLYDNTDYEDFDLCFNYLKKREDFVHKLLNDPNHKAMLYLLEVLLNSSNQTTIEKLVDTFQCNNFTEDMGLACGNDAQGLKLFLERYPALFRVNGNNVSAASIDLPANSESSRINCSSSSFLTNMLAEDSFNNSETEFKDSKNIKLFSKFYPTPDSNNKEIEAVKFFQSKLQKRDEKWVLIKSLAGHLSQAESNIREVVGPQSEFKSFLLRQPDFFEVQGELVSLKESTSLHKTSRKNKFVNGFLNKSNRPKILNVSSLNHERDKRTVASAPTTPVDHNKKLYQVSRYPTLAMENDEYRAIIFLRKVIEKGNGSLNLSHLFLYLHRASETIRNIIGWTKCELQEFIRKNSAFFEMTSKEIVLNKDVKKINVMVTLGNELYDCGTRTLNNRYGNVFHVAKLWGIIDLGHHEHVFFEKSIFRHLDDLQRHFKNGETVYFNAMLAPKESRAKWRATKVWKECDIEMVKFNKNKIPRSNTTNSINMDCILDINSFISDITGDSGDVQNFFKTLPKEIEDELGKILNLGKTDTNVNYFNLKQDKLLKKNVLIEINELQKNNLRSFSDFDYEDDNQSIESILTPDLSSSLSIQSETSLPMNHLSTSDNTSTDSYAQTNKKSIFTKTSYITSEDLKLSRDHHKQPSTMIDCASQTLSTGDIMATNLFHDNVDKEF